MFIRANTPREAIQIYRNATLCRTAVVAKRYNDTHFLVTTKEN